MAFGSDITETIGNVGGRTTAQGFNSADSVRKQYTGYERDDESGLDYAQARYYNSAHGRFTSVDPLTASATIRNPQTFNRYSYVLNSPYKFVDPLGLISVNVGSACCSCSDNDETIQGEQNQTEGNQNSQTAQDAEIPEPPKWTFLWKEKVNTGHGEIVREKKPTDAQQKIIDKLVKNQWAIIYPAARNLASANRNPSSEVTETSTTNSSTKSTEASGSFSFSDKPGFEVGGKSGSENGQSNSEKSEHLSRLKEVISDDKNAINNTAIALTELRESGVTNAAEVIGKANDFIYSTASKLATEAAGLTPLHPATMPAAGKRGDIADPSELIRRNTIQVNHE
jgi:RHS repeat-associated protein